MTRPSGRCLLSDGNPAKVERLSSDSRGKTALATPFHERWAISDLHLSFGAARASRAIRGAGRIMRGRSRRTGGPWSVPGISCCCRATSRWPATIASSSRTWNGWADCPARKSSRREPRSMVEQRRVRPPAPATLHGRRGRRCRGHRGLVVCGTRGAPPPQEEPSSDDRIAVDRELDALRQALDHAARIRDNSDAPLCVLWHFPPFDANGRPGPWVERFEAPG